MQDYSETSNIFKEVFQNTSRAVHAGEPREGLCFNDYSCSLYTGFDSILDLLNKSVLLEGDTFIPWKVLTFSLN